MPDASPEQLVEAVHAALAGGEVSAIAASYGLPADQLEAALTTYHAAGTAAVTRSTDRWYTTRLAFADQRRAEKTMATVVGPLLDTLCVGPMPVDWWFTRRESDWRVYLRHPDPAVLGVFLHDLGRGRPVAATQPLVHDPDMRPYGGPAGLAIAYQLFVAESHGILAYARSSLPLERRDLSILVVDVLLAAAGLSFVARGGVYAQAIALGRHNEAVEPAGARMLAAKLHEVLTNPNVRKAAAVGPWADACVAAGGQFAAMDAAGLLSRGLIDVLAAVVRAQWARLGLSSTVQAVLALAAHDAYGQ
ncbi:thiopeptide-type bacteriocin biosynthesis protein [Pseudofrankia sp. DC12]|uniref:thiopeptide-type bacteriocin biosynthesis protein n=1 Tax=Pseudofrankia sp. DC12 TaxID=683315 RepID=UPI0005F7D5B8|nr:thiopeptide-type bacteriocin biosynthesis protein [Pseudofrankia sp. DC12]